MAAESIHSTAGTIDWAAIECRIEAADREPAQREAERLANVPTGPYYVKPDSADPWPDSIWQRLDLDALDTVVADINAGRFGLTEADEAHFRDMGSPAIDSLLDDVSII